MTSAPSSVAHWMASAMSESQPEPDSSSARPLMMRDSLTPATPVPLSV
jgi:hypothetical protein